MGLVVSADKFYESLTTEEKNSIAEVVIKNLTPAEILEKMDYTTKDIMYRKLWANHVQEDVLNQSRALDKELNDDGIKKVVDRYVYHGDYDCNLSYWDNIENLIDEAYENEDYRFAEPEEELEL